MLKKLLKYEFKWALSTHAPMFLAIVLTTAILLLLSPFVDFMPSTGFSVSSAIPSELAPIVENVLFGIIVMTFIVYVVVLIGSYIASAILANYRFYKSLFSSSGYLTFTLPATPTQLYLSRFIAAVASMTAVIILMSLSLHVVMLFMSDMRFNSFEVYALLMNSLPLTAKISFVLIMIITIPYTITWFYFCLCVGQTQRNRIIVSVIAYFLSYTVTQIISLIMLVIVTIVMAIAMQNVESANIEQYAIDHYLAPIIWLALIIYVAIGVGYFLFSKNIMSRKLNLE